VQDAEGHQKLLDIAARADVYEASGRAWTTSLMVELGLPARYSTRCAGVMAYLVELTDSGRDLLYSLISF
jgi:hypothetical protein